MAFTRCRLYRNKRALKNLSLPKCSLTVCGCSKGGEVEKKVELEAVKEKVELEVAKSYCRGFCSVLVLNISSDGAAALSLGQNDCLGGLFSNPFFPFLIKSLMFQATEHFGASKAVWSPNISGRHQHLH